MRYILLLMLLFPSVCFAQSRDIRISDGEGNVADITADGKLRVSKTTNDTVTNEGGAPDKRISDADGDVADITADGKLRLGS